MAGSAGGSPYSPAGSDSDTRRRARPSAPVRACPLPIMWPAARVEAGPVRVRAVPSARAFSPRVIARWASIAWRYDPRTRASPRSRDEQRGGGGGSISAYRRTGRGTEMRGAVEEDVRRPPRKRAWKTRARLYIYQEGSRTRAHARTPCLSPGSALSPSPRDAESAKTALLLLIDRGTVVDFVARSLHGARASRSLQVRKPITHTLENLRRFRRTRTRRAAERV
jgi:hypothetical protein